MLTYDEILNRMRTKYEERTETLPDRASDIGIRMSVLAGEIFSAQAELNWLKAQMFPHTASGEYLDMHAVQRGLERKSGTKAYGEVTFYLSTLLSYDVEIPEGTIVATEGENPMRYATTETVEIRSGRLATLAPVEALEIGARGNAVMQAVNVIVTPVTGVERVMNDYRMEHGSDRESDEQLRTRILNSFVNISNGTNKAFYVKSAMEVNGVTAVGVVPKNRGVGTVDVFVTTSDGNPSETLLAEVKSHLDSLREINVDIEVKPLKKTLVNVYVYISVKSGYSFKNVRDDCKTAIAEYFSLLNAGEKVYLSDIGEYIQHTDGVENYSFEYNLCSDINTPADCIGWQNEIAVMERGS